MVQRSQGTSQVYRDRRGPAQCHARPLLLPHWLALGQKALGSQKTRLQDTHGGFAD